MSTMLGTSAFDAQMSDYPVQGGDLDVLMQAHSSDTWNTHEDGIMEEDTSFSMLTGKNPESGTVSMFMPATAGEGLDHEVEMEDFEHHSEYEMLDESEVIVADDDNAVIDDLVDVEVADLQPSPENSLTLAAPPTLEPSSAEEAARHRSHSPLPPASAAIAPEVHQDAPVVEPVPTAGHHAIVEAISDPLPPSEGETDQPESAPETAGSDHSPHESHVASSKVDHREVKQLEAQSAGSAGDIPAPAVDATSSEHASFDDTEEQAVSEALAAEEIAEKVDIGEHAEIQSNPHEIDDGVFIEPVPAVVVETSFSEQPFVLFNRLPGSRPQSPSPDDDVPSNTLVLLHDRPTLYYGPLTDLFAALREEEIFTQRPDMHHTELGISVESLQLTISEDNVYAKEFSLFQLNALHDSFHTGSLRVTLVQHIPRFITRYHELQEHLHRLGVHTHEDGPLTVVPSSTGESIVEHKDDSEHDGLEPDQTVHRDGPINTPEEVQVAEESINHEVHPTHEGDQHYLQGDDQHIVKEDAVEPGASEVQPEDHTKASVHHDTTGLDHEDHALSEGDAHAAEEFSGHTQEHVQEVTRLDTAQDESARGADPAVEGPEEDIPAVTEGVDVENDERQVDGSEEASEETSEETEASYEHSVEGYEYVEGQGDGYEDVGEHEHEQGATEDLEGEYSSDFDPHQEEGNGIQGDSEVGDDSEHSGDFHEDNTHWQETEAAQGYPDERSPSPGAEDELPPIDTNLLNAVESEGGGDFVASASAENEWPGEGELGLTADEAHETETLRSEDGNENTENYIDDTSLAYAEGNVEWDQDLDGEGEADPSWDGEFAEQEEEVYKHSTISVRSKRSFREVDGDDDDEEVDELRPTPSPDSKRTRLE